MRNYNRQQDGFQQPIKKVCTQTVRQNHYNRFIQFPQFKKIVNPYTETANIIESFQKISINADMFSKSQTLLNELYVAILNYEQSRNTFITKFNNLCYSYAHFRLTDKLDQYYKMQSTYPLNERVHIFLITGDTGVGKSTLLKTIDQMSTKTNQNSFTMIQLDPNKSIVSDFHNTVVDQMKDELNCNDVRELNKELQQRMCIWVCDEFSHNHSLINRDIQVLKKLFECIDQKISVNVKNETNCQIPSPCLLLMTNDTRQTIETVLLQQKQQIAIHERMITLDLYDLFRNINEIIDKNGLKVPQQYINKWKYLNEDVQLIQMNNIEGQQPEVQVIQQFSMSKFINITQPLTIGIEWIKQKMTYLLTQNICVQQNQIIGMIKTMYDFESNDDSCKLTSSQLTKGKYDLINHIWKQFKTDMDKSIQFIVRYFKNDNQQSDISDSFNKFICYINPVKEVNKIQVEQLECFKQIINQRNTFQNRFNQILHKYKQEVVNCIKETKQSLPDQDLVFQKFILEIYPSIPVSNQDIEDLDIFVIKVFVYYQQSKQDFLIQWMLEVIAIQLIALFQYQYISLIENCQGLIKCSKTRTILQQIYNLFKNVEFLNKILLELLESIITKFRQPIYKQYLEQIDLSTVINQLQNSTVSQNTILQALVKQKYIDEQQDQFYLEVMQKFQTQQFIQKLSILLNKNKK